MKNACYQSYTSPTFRLDATSSLNKTNDKLDPANSTYLSMSKQLAQPFFPAFLMFSEPHSSVLCLERASPFFLAIKS